MYNHYIRLQDGKVVKGFSDAFEQPQKGDILIAENAGRHFEYAGQINPLLIDDDGISLYKYKDDKVVKRTEIEIEADKEALPEPEPSEMEKLKARLEKLETILKPEVENIRKSLDDTRRQLIEKELIENITDSR